MTRIMPKIIASPTLISAWQSHKGPGSPEEQ
jgi:hypothetical protein